MENPAPVKQGRTRPWRSLLFIFGLTVVVTPFAGAFSVPIGEASHIQLPGVLMFVALAIACSVFFMQCPSRPRWSKIAALVLLLPSLYLTVYAVMTYLAFGWSR